MKTPPIVCVAQPSWDGPYAKSTVLLMKELAHNHKVLYVDYASTWKDCAGLLLKGKWNVVRRILGLSSRIRMMNQVFILTLPPVIPQNFLPQGALHRILTRINNWTIRRAILRAMAKLKINKPVVVNAFSPELGINLLRNLNEAATIYYCYDEISQADWRAKHAALPERVFASKTDAVIVTSDALHEEKAKLNKNTFVVKNGVDINVFKTNETHHQSSNVVGFVGSLDSRVDYRLLEEVISANPDLEFRFIGQIVDQTFEKLRCFSNVRWHAPVPYAELPKHIAQFDVGIIPFVKSAFTAKIYPLKINEYLAMGKPVVMTSFAKLPEFESLVLTADHVETFSEALRGSIAGNSPQQINKRIDTAHRNSWMARAQEFETVIQTVSHGN